MRFALPLMLLVCAHGQTANTPPEVDKALRERVRQFYQLHVDGKFRQLDPLIAEESKDEFYEMGKQRYLKFEEPKFEFNDDFTKAVVKTQVEVEWRNARLGTMIVHPIVHTEWKIENGQWVYFIRKEGFRDTPFGRADLTQKGPATPASEMNIKKISVQEVMGAVMVDKQTADLSSFEKSSDTVLITNGMPGQVNLEVQYPAIKGLAITLEKKELQAGEKTKMIIAYEPPDESAKPYVDVALRIVQTTKTIPVRLQFAVKTPVPGMPKR